MKFLRWLVEPFPESWTWIKLGGVFIIFILAQIITGMATKILFGLPEPEPIIHQFTFWSLWWTTALMPAMEEVIFRIGPHQFFGNKGCLMGTIIWAGIHYFFGSGWSVVAAMMVIGVFYYKVVTSERYELAIYFHMGFNLFLVLLIIWAV